MLHQQKDNLDTKHQFPLWTQGGVIAFECAKDTISHIIAVCSALMREEEKSDSPSLMRFEELKQKQTDFARERKNLSFHYKEKISHVCKFYGDKIKQYYKGGECPV